MAVPSALRATAGAGAVHLCVGMQCLLLPARHGGLDWMPGPANLVARCEAASTASVFTRYMLGLIAARFSHHVEIATTGTSSNSGPARLRSMARPADPGHRARRT
jgi:hypothetical protein